LIQLYIRHSGEKALAIFLRMKKGGKDGNYVQAHGAEGGDSINEYALKACISFNFIGCLTSGSHEWGTALPCSQSKAFL
jgi:hypothetical protein